MKKSTPLKTKVHIYRLVLVGWRITKIAKHLKISRQAVDKHIRILEQENLIEQTTKYPKFYRKKKQPQPPLRHLPNSTIQHNEQPTIHSTEHPILPLMLPCKYGALYTLIGRPIGLKYNSRGMATIKEPTYTAQFGRSKAQIWLKSFQGSSPDQILAVAEEALNALSKSFERKYSIKLTIKRIYDSIEWAEISKKRSKKIAEKAGIEKGGSIRVGEAIHKFDDFSHPEFFQINPAHDAKNRGVATDHAKTHYYLYMIVPGTIEKLWKTLEKNGEILDKITSSISVVDQKAEVLDGRIKKMEKKAL